MAEGRARSTGTVEEEAQRLVAAAGEWLRNRQQQNGQAATASGSPDGAHGEPRGPGTAGPADGDATDGRRDDHGVPGDHTTCRGCPWCRAKADWGASGSDTLESLADLLDAAAESLRVYAQSRRDPGHGPGGPEPEQEQEQA